MIPLAEEIGEPILKLSAATAARLLDLAIWFPLFLPCKSLREKTMKELLSRQL
jgi:hypothetical protein